MLVKKTANNRITLPEQILMPFTESDYFDVQIENNCIILKPVQNDKIDKIREKLELLGISSNDITDAVMWARRDEQI